MKTQAQEIKELTWNSFGPAGKASEVSLISAADASATFFVKQVSTAEFSSGYFQK